jgi:hypothetical protein
MKAVAGWVGSAEGHESRGAIVFQRRVWVKGVSNLPGGSTEANADRAAGMYLDRQFLVNTISQFSLKFPPGNVIARSEATRCLAQSAQNHGRGFTTHHTR